MAFTVFTNSTTGYADEVMDNFYHVFDGDRLPRGGASLAPTNGVYDIGSSTHKWNQLHCVNLDVNSISTGYRSIWKLLYSVNATSASTSIEITGLNGDNDKEYMLEVYFMDNTTASLGMIFNGDSSSSYGVQITGGTTGSNPAPSRDTGTSISIIRQSRNDTSTSVNCVSWASFSGISGQPKALHKIEINSLRSQSIHRAFRESWVWTGTGTITSIKFISSENNGMGTGTSISLWGRS